MNRDRHSPRGQRVISSHVRVPVVCHRWLIAVEVAGAGRTEQEALYVIESQLLDQLQLAKVLPGGFPAHVGECVVGIRPGRIQQNSPTVTAPMTNKAQAAAPDTQTFLPR